MSVRYVRLRNKEQQNESLKRQNLQMSIIVFSGVQPVALAVNLSGKF